MMKKRINVYGVVLMLLVVGFMMSCSNEPKSLGDVYGKYKGTLKYVISDNYGNNSGNLEQPYEIELLSSNSNGVSFGSFDMGYGGKEMVFPGIKLYNATISRIANKDLVVYLEKNKVRGFKMAPNPMNLDTLSVEINGVLGENSLKTDEFHFRFLGYTKDVVKDKILLDTVQVKCTFEGYK